MEIPRPDVLRLSLAAGGGTRVPPIITSGVHLAPVVAQAQSLRFKSAKVTRKTTRNRFVPTAAIQ